MTNKIRTLMSMVDLTPNLPSTTIKWDEIVEMFAELKELSGTPQDSIYHAEGDVATHTRLVLQSMLDQPEYQALSDDDKFKMFWAGVFHDCGKPGTTVFEENGRITSVGHSKLGSVIARNALRYAGVGLVQREEICSIINAHQLPFWLYEREDAIKLAARYSHYSNPTQLLIHAKADAFGRVCADQEDLLLRVELARSVFEEIDALDKPFYFANDESRIAYFERDDRSPWFEAYEDYRCEVTMVCGLPGTGKDTWIQNNIPDAPVVSLDVLRSQMGIQASDNQGRVIQAAMEQARGYLRNSKDFVWNAVNVNKLNRDKVVRLLRDYNARIKIVYLEVSPDILLKQNHGRVATVPEKVITKLANKLSPPKADEGHSVEWYFNGNLNYSNQTEKTTGLVPNMA